MKQFNYKDIEEIADKSGNIMNVTKYRNIQIILPEINGLGFIDTTARVIIWFNCSEWDKDITKQKFIVGCVYNILQRYDDNIYYTGRNMHAHDYDIRAEQDPVKFCKHMLQKTINKAKLLRKNEIKKAGVEYDA